MNRTRKSSHISLIGRLIRWRSWSDTKLVLMFVGLGLVMIDGKVIGLFGQTFLFLGFFLLFVCYGSFVSIANDYWDKEVDFDANKNRLVSYLSRRQVFFILCLLLFGFIFFILRLSGYDILSIVLGLILLLLSFLYSNPIIRFKERGYFGLVVGSLIQRTLPLILMFNILDYWNQTVVYFILLSFILGLMMMLMHQMEDYDSDLSSSVKTLMVDIGIKKGQKILNILYILLALIIFLTMSTGYFLSYLLIIYILFWSILLCFKKRNAIKTDIYSLNNYLFSDLIYVWLPLYVCFLVLIHTGVPLLLFIILILQKKHIQLFVNRVK